MVISSSNLMGDFYFFFIFAFVKFSTMIKDYFNKQEKQLKRNNTNCLKAIHIILAVFSEKRAPEIQAC